MKIAVIAKTRLPIAEPFGGGLEAFTHTIVAEYMRRGHDVVLYAHSDSDDRFRVKSFYGEDIRRDPYVDIHENDEYISILKDIEKGNYDIVHNNSTHPLPIIWGAKSRIPVVTTLHTPPYTKLKAATSLASLSHNLHFVSVSKSLEKAWRPYIHSKLSVIYNGIDASDWPLVRGASKYVFWYGRIIENKGLDIAIDAAHKLRMPIYFAGPTPDLTYYESAVIPRLRAGDKNLGHLSQKSIHKHMQGAAVMVNATRWEEPFGLSTIEAMAAGVPIAGFDRGAFRELVNDKSGVIAKGTNVDALAEAMRVAISMPSKAVSEQAQRFPLSKVADQYLTYFKELV